MSDREGNLNSSYVKGHSVKKIMPNFTCNKVFVLEELAKALGKTCSLQAHSQIFKEKEVKIKN